MYEIEKHRERKKMRRLYPVMTMTVVAVTIVTVRALNVGDATRCRPTFTALSSSNSSHC